MNKLLHCARVTLVEHYLWMACYNASQDIEQIPTSRDTVNRQIQGFDTANISASDIQPALWLYTSKVTSGVAPSSKVNVRMVFIQHLFRSSLQIGCALQVGVFCDILHVQSRMSDGSL